METKNGAASTPSYDDFEPLCNWRREQECDTLIVHLPEFKKEQLKVQINTLGSLKISGERPLSATKQSRFYKEIRVSKDCQTAEVNAKFIGGILYIVMPKNVTPLTKENQPPNAQKSQVNKKSKPEINQNQADNGAAKDNIEYSSKNATNYEFKQEGSSSTLKWSTRLAINVAVVVAVVAVGGYAISKYRSSLLVED